MGESVRSTDPEVQAANARLLSTHWVMRRPDGSLLDNSEKTRTSYSAKDMQLFSIIISRNDPPSNYVLANNRLDSSPKLQHVWRILKPVDEYGLIDLDDRQMACGQFALLFALLELGSNEVNKHKYRNLDERVDDIRETVKFEQAHDPIFLPVLAAFNKTLDNFGSLPSALLKTINQDLKKPRSRKLKYGDEIVDVKVRCRGFTAKLEVRRDALKKFPILRACASVWDATTVDNFTKLQPHERALDWMMFGTDEL